MNFGTLAIRRTHSSFGLSLVAGLFTVFFFESPLALGQSDSKIEPNSVSSVRITGQTSLNANSLAELLRPRLPKGWHMTANGPKVILERLEKVKFYNGVSLPSLDSEVKMRAYLKERTWQDQLTVSFWVGEFMVADDFKVVKRKNLEAIDRARKDQSDGKLMPDAAFWKAHPNYGYRELPVLSTGSQSIYIESHPEGAIHAPSDEPLPSKGGVVIGFFDPNVEIECQGFINDLRTLFKVY